MEGRLHFSIGVENTIVSIVNPVWNEADLLATVVSNGLAVIENFADLPFSREKVSLGMHFKAASRTTPQILLGTVNCDRFLNTGEKATAAGFSVETEATTVAAEPSLSFIGSLFVRLEIRAAVGKGIGRLAMELRSMEDRVLAAMGLRLEDSIVGSER
jgi:hypothetical protein